MIDIDEQTTLPAAVGQRPTGPFIASRQSIRRRRRRMRLRVAKYALLAMALLAGLSVMMLIPALAARSHLVRAREAMQAGKAQLLAANTPAAAASFRRAEAEFSAAQGDAHNFLLRLPGVLPLAGRTPDAVSAMASAGGDVARAAAAIADGLAGLPDGLGSLAPIGGQIPLDRFRQLEPSLSRAAGLVDQAARAMSGVSNSWLLGSVADARRDFDRQLLPLRDQLDAAALLVDELPSFLGAGGPRHYFFGAANPAELRGSGGLIGAFSILTAEEGRLSFSRFQNIYALPNVAEKNLQPPNPDFGRRYPAGFWPNIDMSPDFPSVAQAIENLYRTVRGLRLDGTILADPFALQALMRVSGGARLPALNLTVTADNVIPLTTNQAYAPLPDPDARKALLGDVAQAVMDRFLSGVGSIHEAARTMAEAAGGGHVLLHSTDPRVQRGFDLAGVSGRLLPPTRDYLSVVINNGGGNKIDFYAHRSVKYEVLLEPGGLAHAEVSVTIRNDAPLSGLPIEVIGPINNGAERGQNVSLVSEYLSGDADLVSALEDGRKVRANENHELGHVIAEGPLTVESGQTRTLTYGLALPHAWTGSSAGGVYRLIFQGQAVINPTAFTFQIQAPPGTRIVRTSVPMRIEGGLGTWTGVALDRMVLEVAFQKPLLPRIWDRLTHFLNKRVF